MEVKDILLKEMSDTKAINISFPIFFHLCFLYHLHSGSRENWKERGYGEYLRMKQEKERREKAKW